MLFNSIQYILFLPIVAMLYFLIPSRFRWIGNIILSQEMDYQRVNYYLDITQPLDNGLYRYSVETFGNSDIAFTCVENGEELVHQEYSEKNYIDLPKLTKNQS